MNRDTVIMPKVHQGRNIKRFRDILGVKQETLAAELDMTQQAFSKLEQKEQIDEKTLSKVAEALHVPVEALKNMTDEVAVNIVANTFNNNDTSTVVSQANYNYYPTFNIMDKVVELFERLLKAEQEKISLLQEALRDKK